MFWRAEPQGKDGPPLCIVTCNRAGGLTGSCKTYS